MVAIYILVLFLACFARGVQSECTFQKIHERANECLSTNNVERGTEFLMPTFNATDGVINFCATINDIQSCITNVISACASSKKIHQMFGSMGSALSSAYVGVCKEHNRNALLTCAFPMSNNITMATSQLISSADSAAMHNANHSVICQLLHDFHHHIMHIFDESVANGDCEEADRLAVHKYMSTILFPCDDVATDYYPCTLERINVDALECYSSNHVSVKNALVPTPVSLSHADEMCSNKGMVQSCIKNLITKCVYEPQVTSLFGTAAEGITAGYNCMCKPEHFGMILTCAATADVTTPMNQFFSSVHNLSVAGTHSKFQQCSLQSTMKAQIQRALDTACADPSTRGHWKRYLDTIEYPCTDQATACFPKSKYNGAETSCSLRTLFLMLLALVLHKMVMN